MNKIYNIIEFDKNMPDTFEQSWEIAQKIEDGYRNIIVVAPPKCGKRVLEEIITQLLGKNKNDHYSFYHFTKLDRRDSREQFDELELYGINTTIVTSNSDHKVRTMMSNIEKDVKSGKTPVVFFDESDYGTGADQVMGATVWNKLSNLVSNDKMSIVLLSATQEEVMNSSWAKFPGTTIIVYNPEDPKYDKLTTKKYFGPKWYLNNRRYGNAEVFYVKDEDENILITQHGKALMNDFMQSKKLFSVLRIVKDYSLLKDPYKGEGKLSKALHALYPDLEIVYADGKNPLIWSNARNATWRSYKECRDTEDPGLKVLIVICQTCSRSTEVCFREHICWWHDYRSNYSRLNTIVQAIGRVFFREYADKVKLENYPILYTPHCKEILEYTSFQIDNNEFYKRTHIHTAGRIDDIEKTNDYDPKLISFPLDRDDKHVKKYIIENVDHTAYERFSEKLKKLNDVSPYNLSKDEKIDLALEFTKGNPRGKTVWHIDGPNKIHENSFDMMIQSELFNDFGWDGSNFTKNGDKFRLVIVWLKRSEPIVKIQQVTKDTSMFYEKEV